MVTYLNIGTEYSNLWIDLRPRGSVSGFRSSNTISNEPLLLHAPTSEPRVTIIYISDIHTPNFAFASFATTSEEC